MIPNTSFSVNTIQDHLPTSGRQKRNSCIPVDREATATVLVFSEYPKILQ